MDKAKPLTLAERPLERLVRPGIYRIREAKAPRDPELENGLLEIYEHPIKGLCFWDQGQDGDSDGHVPVGFLDGEELEYVGPNAKVSEGENER